MHVIYSFSGCHAAAAVSASDLELPKHFRGVWRFKVIYP